MLLCPQGSLYHLPPEFDGWGRRGQLISTCVANKFMGNGDNSHMLTTWGLVHPYLTLHG